MPKLSIEVNELQDAHVGLVSLVKRGANRIPFRIVKEDTTEMLDLSTIRQTMFAKSASAPILAGVLLSKSADVALVTAALATAGVDLSAGFVKSEDDTSVGFAKSDVTTDAATTLVLKADDDLAFVITGVDAEFVKGISGYDWESTSFSEVMTKGTFAPSVGMAQEMLQRTFYNIYEKAEDPKGLAAMMKTAVSEFESYVVSLAKGLPTSVFKAEEELVKGGWFDKKKKKGKGKEVEAEETKKEEISSAPVHGNETKPLAVGDKDGNIEGSPAAGNGTPTQSGDKIKNPATDKDGNLEGAPANGATSSDNPLNIKKEDEPAPAVDPLKGVMDLFQEQFAALTANVQKSVDTAVAAVKTEVAAVSQRVDSLQTQVKKADDALGTTVLGTSAGDTLVSKSDQSGGGEPPLLDTAYMKVEAPRTGRSFQ